jgi:hypothetical protein
MKRTRRLAFLLLVALAGCSVEKLPPARAVHRGVAPHPRRVVVLPPECNATWCRGAGSLVAAELAFRGIEIIDLDELAAIERTRTVVHISETRAERGTSGIATQTRVTVVGPMLSDVDLWTRRAALKQLGVDAIVRVRAAKLFTRPVRALALVRVTRSQDAELVTSSACETELSRLDSDAEMMDRVLRCALQGIAR